LERLPLTGPEIEVEQEQGRCCDRSRTNRWSLQARNPLGGRWPFRTLATRSVLLLRVFALARFSAGPLHCSAARGRAL